MNKYKLRKTSEYEHSDVDDDDVDKNVKSCKIKKNYNTVSKRQYDDDSNSDDDEYYAEEILNHPKSKKKKEIPNYDDESDIDNDDKLSYIVQAVLEELKDDKSNEKKQKKQGDETSIKFAKQIDRYLESDHIKRNRYLVSNNEFQRKLKKLMKSLCNLDFRDESIPKFTETEKSLMKIFFKEKQEQHDR